MKAIEQLHIHTLPDPPEERKVLIANLDRLIETVKSHIQPPVRAVATASTLEQLSILIPDDLILAHLVVGWQILSHSSRQKEEPATTQRRVTCGELANLAAQFTTDRGNIAQAVRAWHVWAEAFKKSDDPRQAAMANTFARELTELQEAAATT
jgi:hypothetical protein